jgi:ectoine hydroxylase-related dioxygenase (phytanoyl-CoA dioxygenase family)
MISFNKINGLKLLFVGFLYFLNCVSHALPKTDDFLEEYQQRGYVVLPGFLDESEIKIAQYAAKRVQEKAFQIGNSQKQLQQNPERILVDGSQFVLAKTESPPFVKIHRVVWAGACEPDLLKIGRKKELLELVSVLLGSDQADHLVNQIHFKLPGDGVEFFWHQDVENRKRFDGNWEKNHKNTLGSYVQTAIALNDITPLNGPLFLVPESHRLGDLNLEQSKNQAERFRIIEETKTNLESQKTPWIAKPGDLILWHPHTLHASFPNDADHPRTILINGFSYPGANKEQYPGTGSSERINLR